MNDLIEQHWPLVKAIAGKIYKKLPPSVEYGDLCSYGADGLFDAAENFDPGRGVKFATYAGHRIIGAIRDGIRNDDWLPRSQRIKAKADSSFQTPKKFSFSSVRLKGEKRDVHFGDSLAAENIEQPDEALHRRELFDILLKGLPNRERQVMRLYYDAGWTMKEAGQVIGVSESRVSHLRIMILKKLRERFAGREEEFRLN